MSKTCFTSWVNWPSLTHIVFAVESKASSSFSFYNFKHISFALLYINLSLLWGTSSQGLRQVSFVVVVIKHYTSTDLGSGAYIVWTLCSKPQNFGPTWAKPLGCCEDIRWIYLRVLAVSKCCRTCVCVCLPWQSPALHRWPLSAWSLSCGPLAWILSDKEERSCVISQNGVCRWK